MAGSGRAVHRVFVHGVHPAVVRAATLLLGLVAVVTTACGGTPAPLSQVGSEPVGLTAAPVSRGAAASPGGVDPRWVAARARPDLPARAVRAYASAELLLATADPGCHLSWTVLAGIGEVESAHGTVGGSVLGGDGVSTPLVRGPRLDGTGGVALVQDTDGGSLDGLGDLDRAVGPMQLIPGTWRRWATDGDGDGVADPDDLDDAAATAGRYLCAAGGDLGTAAGWTAAVLAYNHSDAYLQDVHDASERAAH